MSLHNDMAALDGAAAGPFALNDTAYHYGVIRLLVSRGAASGYAACALWLGPSGLRQGLLIFDAVRAVAKLRSEDGRSDLDLVAERIGPAVVREMRRRCAVHK